MKKSSIIVIAFILLAGHSASGQEWNGGQSKVPKPLSVETSDSLSEESCIQLYNFGVSASDNGEYLQSYDSLKKYIDSCANNSYPSLPSAFNYMSGDVSRLEVTDTALGTDYQLWLRSVLYLDTTNPEYFCQCAEQIGFEIYYPSPSNGSVGLIQTDTGLAVLYWLIQHTTCDTPELWHEYEATRGSQYQLWQEIGEGALDTTIPPLPPALDSLLERHFLYESVSEPQQPGILFNASASPNPVTSGTVIYFSISTEAYVRMNLFDVLGHEVTSSGFESLFQPGNYDITIGMQNLPSETYFARIMTAYGEVQTVKLVKE